jgi:hypothetical protein
MIVMSQSTACSLRLKKRKGDSNPKGTAVRAPALQEHDGDTEGNDGE